MQAEAGTQLHQAHQAHCLDLAILVRLDSWPNACPPSICVHLLISLGKCQLGSGGTDGKGESPVCGDTIMKLITLYANLQIKEYKEKEEKELYGVG